MCCLMIFFCEICINIIVPGIFENAQIRLSKIISGVQLFIDLIYTGIYIKLNELIFALTFSKFCNYLANRSS